MKIKLTQLKSGFLKMFVKVFIIKLNFGDDNALMVNEAFNGPKMLL